MKLRTKRICNKDSIRKCDIPCVPTLKHYDCVKRKFSQCVSVSGRIPGTERPNATKFRRQPRQKVYTVYEALDDNDPYKYNALHESNDLLGYKNENSAPRY